MDAVLMATQSIGRGSITLIVRQKLRCSLRSTPFHCAAIQKSSCRGVKKRLAKRVWPQRRLDGLQENPE
jgi:hypothetical protein